MMVEVTLFIEFSTNENALNALARYTWDVTHQEPN